MKKAFKRVLKRIFIFILIALVIYLVVSNLSMIRDLARKSKISLIIDTDAARGYDDLISITRLVMNQEVELSGLLSAQWRLYDLDNDSTVMLNHDLNYLILKHFNLTQLPRYRGEELPLGFIGTEGKTMSPASAIILKRASEVPPGEKLDLVCLGPVTNLAKALEQDPSMSMKIRCYLMGPSYDPARRVWNKNEINTRLDLDAMDALLNNSDLEINLMPENIAKELILNKKLVLEKFSQKDSLFRYIYSRIEEETLGMDYINLESMALIQAILSPEMSSQKQVITPSENTQRKINLYTRIDPVRMEKRIWKVMQEYAK